MSTWLSRLPAVTNHFMSGEKRRWYGSMMPVTTRCTSAVRGFMKVSESLAELATITERSSGVRYRWCGSLPVLMRWISLQRLGSITLTEASSELSTRIGDGALLSDAGLADAPAVAATADIKKAAKRPFRE